MFQCKIYTKWFDDIMNAMNVACLCVCMHVGWFVLPEITGRRDKVEINASFFAFHVIYTCVWETHLLANTFPSVWFFKLTFSSRQCILFIRCYDKRKRKEAQWSATSRTIWFNGAHFLTWLYEYRISMEFSLFFSICVSVNAIGKLYRLRFHYA